MYENDITALLSSDSGLYCMFKGWSNSSI